MSAQDPACQLLARQQDHYAALWVVGPPTDSWLVDRSTGVVSGDHDVLAEWATKGKQATTPFDIAADDGLGKEIVLFWPKPTNWAFGG